MSIKGGNSCAEVTELDVVGKAPAERLCRVSSVDRRTWIAWSGNDVYHTKFQSNHEIQVDDESNSNQDRQDMDDENLGSL